MKKKIMCMAVLFGALINAREEEPLFKRRLPNWKAPEIASAKVEDKQPEPEKKVVDEHQFDERTFLKMQCEQFRLRFEPNFTFTTVAYQYSWICDRYRMAKKRSLR